MNQNELKQFVLDNPKLVKAKESIRYPGLYILKYARRVFYDNLWNDFLEECRGTIVDVDYNVVSRPFTKIYNFGVEDRAIGLTDEDVVTAYRKVNGFMASVTWYQDDILVSTTGSTESDFVDYAYDHINLDKFRAVCKSMPTVTFMFECVHKEDPHIVPEVEGMYLLGYRENSWDSVCYPDHSVLAKLAGDFGCFVPEALVITVSDLKKIVQGVDHEGFVLYAEDGRSTKIKSPHYLFNKFIARVSTNKLIQVLKSGSYKMTVEEEFYPVCTHLRDNVDSFAALDEQARLTELRRLLSNK